MTLKEHYEAVIRESSVILALLEEKERLAFSDDEHERLLKTVGVYKQTIAEYQQKLADLNHGV